MSAQNELTRNLSPRSVVAGVFSVFALMILFMFLAGAFGFWNFDVGEIKQLGSGFWFYSFIAWAISNYFGAYTAALASPSDHTTTGILHGFIVWACSSVIGMMFIGIISGSVFQGLLLPATSEFILWGAFTGDVLAMVVALRGGFSGSIRSKKISAPGERVPDHEERRTEPAFSH